MAPEQKKLADMAPTSYQGSRNPAQGNNTQFKGPSANQPLVNLQVYPQDKPKPPRDFMQADYNKIDPSLFLPTYMTNPFIPAQYGIANTMMQPHAPIVPTILKNYIINAPGPVGMQEKISYIYEDMLPTINIPGKITTLRERISLHSYLRSLLFPTSDGSDINLDERSNSLMQYLKYMDMNPYNTYELEQNPYKTLPKDFVLYRSCYPMQKDDSNTKCAKNSIGMNLRIYKLDAAAYNVHKPLARSVTLPAGAATIPTAAGTTTIPGAVPIVSGSVKKYTDFEQWREIKYYEFIRDNILKKNICPNFVNLFGYYINEKSEIDFAKLWSIKTGIPVSTAPGPATFTGMPTTVAGLMSTIRSSYPISYTTPTMYFGQALVALTEAPLYNLFAFSSTIYVRDGPVKRMTSTGYYNEYVWHSVLFQIMIALYVLQKEKIYFNNFQVDYNIFIKDLSLHSNLTNFWKYRINNIDYYVPNYGFLAMVDVSYKDELLVTSIPQLNKKIYAAPLGDKNIPSLVNIEELVFDNMFKKVFNPNIFTGSDFISKGGIKPPTEIITLLGKIYGDRSSKDILYFIEKYMRKFVNNRIGTYLKELEVPNIRRDYSEFTEGQILVHEIGASAYKFVILLKDNGDNTCKILSKIDSSTSSEVDKFKEETVSKGSLYGYLRSENIEQTFKPNEINLNEEDLLETYLVY